MMMFTSTLTPQSQTTPPAPVRKLLHLEPGDKVGYVVEGDEVRLINATREASDESDPVIEQFLAFLSRDIKNRRGDVQPLPEWLRARAHELVAMVEIDHDAPIEGAIEL